MKLLTLNCQGRNKGKYYAIVDDDMYPFVCIYNWHVHKGRNTFYGQRIQKVDGKKIVIKLHRFIMGETNPKIEIDHEDGNGLK